MLETSVLSLSGNQTLKRFPFGQTVLGNLPIAVWNRPLSASAEYFAGLSTNTIISNMTDGENHFFIFHKRFADEIVRITSAVVQNALNG